MKHAAEIQCVVYAIAATLFGFVIFGEMTMVVWGVPIHPLEVVAFLSSIVLLVGAVKSASRPELGRKIAIAGIAGLGGLCAPWLIGLVPRHNVTYSPIAYVVVVGYVVLLAFCLVFPRPFKLSVAIFLVLLGAGTVYFAITYQRYVRIGEYDRPRIDCIRWYPEPSNDIVVAKYSEEVIDPDIKRFLQQAGIHGTLSWRGSNGGEKAGKRMIVLAKAKPPSDTKLYHPKDGLLLYAFDGTRWIKFPPDAKTYLLFASFEDTPNEIPTTASMLYEYDVDGGKTGTAGFEWDGRDKSDVPSD
jgi:hypothetical protein